MDSASAPSLPRATTPTTNPRESNKGSVGECLVGRHASGRAVERCRLETALGLQTDGEIRRRAPETEGHGGSGSQPTGRSELAHQLIGDGDVTPMQSLELLRALSQQLGVILPVLGDESGCLKLIDQPRAENGVLAPEPLHPERVEGIGHGRVESREDEIAMPRQSALLLSEPAQAAAVALGRSSVISQWTCSQEPPRTVHPSSLTKTPCRACLRVQQVGRASVTSKKALRTYSKRAQGRARRCPRRSLGRRIVPGLSSPQCFQRGLV
eukprot:scaffold5251_cov128-Isochrysis_galbana.AAC.1